MAPDHSDEELASEQLHSDSAAEAESKAEVTSKNAKFSRKRTKTGCLTCRKRRIKCGEERPVCKNCVKSRRQCEGYNRPVTFKPTFDFRSVPHGGAHITFQAGPFPGPATPVVGLGPAAVNDLSNFDNIRPRPPGSSIPGYDAQGQQIAALEQYMGQFPFLVTPSTMADQGHGSHYPLLAHQQPPTTFPQSAIQGETAIHAMAFDPAHISPALQSITPDLGHGELPSPFVHVQPGPPVPPAYQFSNLYPDTPVSPLRPQPLPQNPSVDNLDRHRPWVDTNFQGPTSDHAPRAFSMSYPLPSQPWLGGARAPGFNVTSPADYLMSPTSAGHHYGALYPAAPAFSQSAPTTPYGFEQEAQFPPRMSPNYFLHRAAVETQDDDYYDVESQEMEDDTSASEGRGRAFDHQRTLSNLLAMTQIAVPGSQMRRYDTFIYHGILNHYRVEYVANPLRNPATARVFAHFISVTGPMLSIYERHPKNTSVLFAKAAIPFSQQGLWTYTMPMAALHHQGLLHAMLALASLHIARLQGASTTPSMQHYAWALKRIHHCVGHPKKRLKLTTIAASMLLGFYEVMTAEHMKWSMHLAGSKQLYIETDFAKMTQEFRRMKLEKVARDQMPGQPRAGFTGQFEQDDLLDQMPDVDDRVISRLVGREVRYDNHGSIETPQERIPRSLDLSEYASLRDLYWWYCKQDVIQSILSGNPLLMDFSRWHNCPPRAPLGRADAVYGSFDHLILLLGRIADFVARDRTRKLRQIEANGGHWRPAPGMKIPRPPPQQHGAPSTPVSATHVGGGFDDLAPGLTGPQPADPSMAMPQFYGMAPSPSGDVRMPASYAPAQFTTSTQQDMGPPFTTDLVADTEAALDEYGQIRAALLTFSNSLGETFEPLTSEYQPTMQTPFGPASFYRSYDIGCLWAYYNMAVIIAIRSHPHMPPAAHMAAGIAAQETAFFANEIGRITAGIAPGSSDEQLNPSLGSALNESCLPSFFAAVQYQDPAQRHFTATRIFNIAQRTGWGSAELIANGCETAWVRGAEAGRGPPYERVVRPHSSNKDDPRLNGSWEHLDPNMMPDIFNESDRRLVTMNANARLNWAIGVMGMEGDVGNPPPGH